jgi:hypothetical protein
VIKKKENFVVYLGHLPFPLPVLGPFPLGPVPSCLGILSPSKYLILFTLF